MKLQFSGLEKKNLSNSETLAGGDQVINRILIYTVSLYLNQMSLTQTVKASTLIETLSSKEKRISIAYQLEEKDPLLVINQLIVENIFESSSNIDLTKPILNEDFKYFSRKLGSFNNKEQKKHTFHLNRVIANYSEYDVNLVKKSTAIFRNELKILFFIVNAFTRRDLSINAIMIFYE